MDTEADSLHHYIEKLCLLQISIPDEDFVIDPLSGIELGPLMRILEQKPIILHGADFDIRILNRFYGFRPSQVFDTMIAAQLLGYEKQGLADLVHKHCGVLLSKSAQTADWSKRPLGEVLLTYAMNDTHYLHAVQTKIEEELISLGRLGWHDEFCERVVRTATTEKGNKIDAQTRWQIKGSKDLNGRQLALLKRLWQWREEEAKKKDRPTFKILNSEALLEIARWADQNKGNDIALWPKAPRNVKQEYRDVLNQTIAEALLLPEISYTAAKKWKGKFKRSTAESEKRLTALKTEREQLAKELKIHPSLLITNAVLEGVAVDNPKNRGELEKLGGLMRWQTEMLAEGILKITNG